MLMFALGVTSGKENRWFKDISQISADPPSPNLIFDFFILDKYKLVFTPSHSKMSEIKIILNFWFELDPPSPIWRMSLNHLGFFLNSPLSNYSVYSGPDMVGTRVWQLPLLVAEVADE